jgi:GT2 family glycosyltransferase
MPPGTQVIVVDDGSTDGTLDWLRAAHPCVEGVQTPSNLGFCGAVNLGLQHVRGDVVELLNNDTTVSPGWAEAALAHFDDPKVGSVAPLTLVMDRPHVIDSAGQEYHLIGWARNIGYGQELGPQFLETREVFGASGCSGFYRRSVLDQLGGLLPEYGAYFEDTDLAFRVRWAGYRCIYEPSSRVFHKGSASYGQQPDRLVKLISRNEEVVFWINLPLPQLLVGLVPHLGFQAVRAVRKTLSGQLGAYLAGKREALGLARRIIARRRELSVLGRKRPALALTTSPRVLGQGVVWLRKRKCA